MIDNKKVITGVHDFDWLYTQISDATSRQAVEKIIAIEKSFMSGHPMSVSNDFMKLSLGGNVIWTKENTTHSIPFGYVQVFKLLDEILPSEFRQPMEDLIVDAGANEGHWSLYMYQHHPMASLLAIEPNPTPLELLHKNFAANNMGSIAVLPIALSDTSGSREMETLDNVTSLGSFHIDRAGRPWLTEDRIRKITVDCKRLDDLPQIKKARSIDLLKIDVEGAELAVINGAAQGFTLLLDHEYSPGRGDLFFYKHDT